MSVPILPIDLQLEIFSYLPCKAIMRFMVLSRLHHSLLISPDFISRHHHKSRNKFFFLVPSYITCLCEDDDHFTLFQNLMLPVGHYFCHRIIGICNGIICMQMDGVISFINPMIRYCFDLALHDDEDRSIYSYNFTSYRSIYCYDFISRRIYSYGFISRGLSDYLVVKMVSYSNDEGESFPLRNAWVYTYVKDDWRPLEIPDCSLCITPATFAYNGVVHSGLLHWGAKKWVENTWYYFILTFDPQTEVFGELLLADNLVAALYHPDNYERGVFVGIFVVQNNNKPLTVYSLNSPNGTVWVMDRYGITESWNQIFTFNWTDNYISSTLFSINPDIYRHLLRFPFLLFHRDDGTLLFGAELNCPQYLLRSLDISHGTCTVLNNIGRRIGEDLYIGYSSPSLVLLDKVSASMGAKKWVENTWYYFILTFDPQTEVFRELLLADNLVAAYCHPDNYEREVFVGIFVVQNNNKPLTVYSLNSPNGYHCRATVNISSDDVETTPYFIGPRLKAIQATFERRNELEMLPRSANYFLDRALEISKTDYEPSDMDILYAEGISLVNGLKPDTLDEYVRNGREVMEWENGILHWNISKVRDYNNKHRRAKLHKGKGWPFCHV
ncbi:hypothetical protein VNO80_23900 [Phaseolus coccineus]|uniref:F-box domain-containing protein n=1 Tax=Phaseolus coccineus TaxID=3886 RepID=A0AAN9QVF5_PHACN